MRRPLLIATMLAAGCELSPAPADHPRGTGPKTTPRSYADRCELPDDESSGGAATSFQVVTGDKTSAFRTVALVTLSTGDVCSAVLVTPDRLVTAAHCFEGGVSVAALSFADDAAAYEVASTTLHPAYADALGRGKSLATDPELASADVAVLTLAAPPVGREPARLYAGPPLAAGRLVALVGHGDTGLGAGSKRWAQSHVGRWIDDERLGEARFRGLLLLDSRTGTGACPGDSGGGIYVRDAAGYALVGVVDGVNDVLYPGFPVASCTVCPRGIGVVTRLADHRALLEGR